MESSGWPYNTFMPENLAIGRRQRLWAKGIGLPGDNTKILGVARHLCERVDAPVLGGIAVILHGHPRTTTDLDLYTLDRKLTDCQLRAAGARWHPSRQEHVLDDVRIHTVTRADAGHVVGKTLVIGGVRVVSLPDLVAINLICGLRHLSLMKLLGDVQELILRVPLDKHFARKLPPAVRTEFKTMVDAVRAGERQRKDKPRF